MSKGQVETWDWKSSLREVLKAHNGAKQDGSSSGHATRDKRADVLFAGFRALRSLGYKMDDVRSFRQTHLKALAKAWEQRGLAPATLQNNISIFRTFAGWIGKAGMIERTEKYVSPGAGSRSSINRVDKSWSSRGVDVAVKLAEVRTRDVRVALQLELQRVFGLRAREAMQLRPHVADKGSYLLVNLGTKGGRDRIVDIKTDEQRALLDYAKTLTSSQHGSTSDPAKSLAQWKNHYYAVVRACGITRADGITTHGLRHERANDRYQALTGVPSPVRGGGKVQRERDYAARLVIAEELGHSRESVTTHYLGRG